MSTIRQPEGTTPSGEQPALCDGSGVLYSMRISEGDKPCPGCANCQQQPEPSAGLTPEREWASLITSFFDKHGYVSTVDSGLQTALDAARARIAELEADNRNVTFNNGELLQICEKHMAQIAEVERERDEWKKRCASDLDDAHRFREQAIEWKGKKEQAERDRDAALARAEKAEASHTEALDSLAAASERIAALEAELAARPPLPEVGKRPGRWKQQAEMTVSPDEFVEIDAEDYELAVRCVNALSGWTDASIAALEVWTEAHKCSE